MLPDLDIKDAAMAASGLLDQFREMGMDDSIQRTLAKKNIEADILERLKRLIVKFDRAIQAHDAKVAAVQAALDVQAFHIPRG
jgi:hypothetical protein